MAPNIMTKSPGSIGQSAVFPAGRIHSIVAVPRKLV